MRWLQLTDFHIGRQDNTAQMLALRSLVSFLTKTCTSPVDAILLVGDIAYSGKREEYERFAELLLVPLREDPNFQNASVMAVPGNHDIDSDEVDPLTWENIGSERQQTYFNENESGKRTRKARSIGFCEFDRFTKKHRIAAPICAQEVATNATLENSDGTFTFVLANTSFFCNKERDIKDDGRLPAPLPSLRERLHNVEGNPGTFVVVGHHPLEAFLYQDRNQLVSLLAEKRAIYLHGHVHVAEATYQPEGLESLGTGAAYQAPQGAAPTAYYRNTCAFCSVADNQLTVELYHWDTEHGRWVATTTVPSKFPNENGVPKGTYLLALPGANSKKKKRPPTSPDVPARRHPGWEALTLIQEASPTSVLSLEPVAKMLRIGALEDAREINESAGKMVLQYAAPGGQARVSITTASGRMLTREDVEDANTRIDYEGLVEYVFLSFGPVSDGARTSFDRLRSRKPLRLVERAQVAELVASQLGPEALERVRTLDAAIHSVELLIDPSQIYVLIYDNVPTWFCILDAQGELVPESALATLEIREKRPRFANALYRLPNGTAPDPKLQTRPTFNRGRYLDAAYKEFNRVKYAALASLGFRLDVLTLDQLYVDATATDGDADEAAVAKAVDEALQSLGLPDDLRLQLESQIRGRLRGGRSQESMDARRLYQRSGIVLLLGDPGSGKTCFVKHEILSYCSPDGSDAWYRNHLPVYIALSELAQLQELDGGKDLHDYISTLNKRRGLDLSREMLVELSTSGNIAYFFDGLDEVTNIEQRAEFFAEIAKIVEESASTGNRVVITSRPAAVRFVELPNSLRPISLKGLSETEMRVLAQRVLRSRLTEDTVDLALDEGPLEGRDEALVEKIIADCRAQPGLRRLAQNPLLLTLLIMIYANTGAPAAKRHRVYQQAVQTLATVRGRQAGHRVFSESDLRRRLGAVALAMFKRASPMVPRWNDAVQIVAKTLSSEQTLAPHRDPTQEAEDFLQMVGESTGLVIPRRPGKDNEGESFTFMHYSFLEYYTSVGLSLERDSIAIATEHSNIPRWREVLLLFSGILADQSDAGPLINSMLAEPPEIERLTLERLMFAIECALEAEVPSTAQLSSILSAISKWGTISLTRDPSLRADLGILLARLYESSKSELISDMLVTAIESERPLISVVGIDLAARVFEDVDGLPQNIVGAFAGACKRKESPILVAICDAYVRARGMRTKPSGAVIRGGFRGTRQVIYAAARACERWTPLAESCWDELLRLVREAPAYLALTAANAVLKAGWSVDFENEGQRSALSHALNCVLLHGQESDVKAVGQSIDFKTAQRQIATSHQDRRILGIRLLPWVTNADPDVQETILTIIHEGDRVERVAALHALRLCPGARKLLRIADLDSLYALLHADTKDVRATAARLLGSGQVEQKTNRTLLAYATERNGTDEYRAALRAIGESNKDLSDIHDQIELDLVKKLRSSTARKDATKRDILELLQLSLQSNELGSSSLLSALRRCVNDRAFSAELRGASLISLAWLSRPTTENMRYLAQLSENKAYDIPHARAEAIWRFTLRCKRRIEYVRSVRSDLDELQQAALSLAAQTAAGAPGQLDFSNLRRALMEISSMRNAYDEYAARSAPES